MFFFKSKKIKKSFIHLTYQNIIKRSRSKFFYLNLEIEDNFESRFDIIILHSFIIFYYFKKIHNHKSEFAQLLFDYMFKDFDNNLREMGFGDIAVNKKMKVFISAFYGRISQYSKGINELQVEGKNTILYRAIINNLYKGKSMNENYLDFYTEYIVKNIKMFSLKKEIENMENGFQFIDLPSEEK